MAKFTSDAVVLPGNIRTNSSVQEFTLGSKAVTPDGRVYRYVKVGATALVAGKLYDGPANVGNHTNISVASAAAAGASTVTVTLGATAATANQYAGGVLVVNDAAGEGFTYSIKSHPAADASASLVLTLDDEETIVTALTTDSEVSLIPNQYNGVIIHATTETGVPVGVAVTQVTATYYGWVQTRGPVSVLSDSSISELGSAVAASATTAGSVTVGTGALATVGTQLTTGASGEYNVVFLNLD